ncbi:hypothetical protein [Halostella pelagica]|uniref:hypothetical protein n=1 Tax=Halostella pelagica TaxID=2583824 RepID=UPI001F2F9027|nr:hypothetical protein [Halostella pelagica]
MRDDQPPNGPPDDSGRDGHGSPDPAESSADDDQSSAGDSADESPAPAQVIADAEDHRHDRSLTPEEYEQLKHAVAELTPIFTHDSSYFVLGSYGDPEIRRLQFVKDRLNRRRDTYAFLMVDVRREWTNTYLKFRILADYADTIVGVAEHDGGGFLVEQGLFVADEEYFEKTHVCKREYDGLDATDLDTDADPERPYSGMQTPIFEMLDESGRLHRWTTTDDLAKCVAEIE